jgi:uncharacterized membrane protein
LVSSPALSRACWHRARTIPQVLSSLTLLGIAGAFVATFIGQAVGWYGRNEGAGLIGAVIGAIVVLFVWHRLVTNRVISDPGSRRWL